MKNNEASRLQGVYRDQLHDEKNNLIWDGGWRTNLIVNSCNPLLAALMRGEPGFSGILYWAVGEGAASWDKLSPSPDAEDGQLAKELARKALSTEDIVYLDEKNQAILGPTARLQIGAIFTREELGGSGTRSLREFGLFGGDATEALNSGRMIDYVIHPRIQLTAGMTLTRNLHLTFGLGGGSTLASIVGGFAAALPVISIDGVGQRYAPRLNAVGVNTLSELIGIDPLQPLAGIPGVKLREFRAKARMVLGLQGDFSAMRPLAQRSLSDLLKADPDVLAAEIGSAAVNASQVIQMQEALAILQVALDESVLQEISLGDLLRS